MKKYGYVKKQVKRPPNLRLVASGFSIFFMMAGVSLITSVVWPILQWQFFVLPTQPEEKFVSPVPSFLAETVLGAQTASDSAEFSDSWMPKQIKSREVKISRYTLSIPKLRIDKAIVEVGSSDLSKSLIGWADSSVPGKNGTSIIFGHSILPQFYNPRNYKTIFTMLPTLKKGDPIFVNYDGVDYRYQVIDLTTYNPDDYSILEERFDDSYLSLVTCVPPGTYWKRLVVRARMVKF